MPRLDDIAAKEELTDEDLDEIESEFDPKHVVWRLTAEVRRLRTARE